MGRRKRRRNNFNWRMLLLLLLLAAGYAWFRANYAGIKLIPKAHRHTGSSQAVEEGRRPRRRWIDPGMGRRVRERVLEKMPDIRKKEKASPPADKEKVSSAGPVAALVIDDFGYGSGRSFLKIDASLTFAVLPGLPHSRTVARQAVANGHEVILHLPMEPESGTARLERDTVMAGMGVEEVGAILERDLAEIPQAVGISNHMGSRATADRTTMNAVMSILDRRKIFFLDSLTSSASVAGTAADRYGVACLTRDVFLDGSDEPGYIDGQLRRLLYLARRNGQAVGIGHDRSHTALAIERFLPEFSAAGVLIVPLSALL